MAVDMSMYRKGLDPKKTYYQIEKEKADKAEEDKPVKRGRGRPKKIK